MAIVAFDINGFCKEEENPFGPVQEYVAPATPAANRFKVDPTQIGLLLVGVAVGIGLTVTIEIAVSAHGYPRFTINFTV